MMHFLLQQITVLTQFFQKNIRKKLTHVATVSVLLLASSVGHAQLNLHSKAALVVNLDTNRVMVNKNANQSNAIASISKIITAMVVIDSQKNSMHESVCMQSVDKKNRDGKRVSSQLSNGECLNRAQMLMLMLVKSDNGAARALARTYPGGYNSFIGAMQNKSKQLGMVNSFFDEPSGLSPNNVASPRDLVNMLKVANEYEVIRRFTNQKSFNFAYTNRPRFSVSHTNNFVREGGRTIGVSKTGFIRESGHCMVMETMVNGQSIAIVILGAPNSSKRTQDIRAIIKSIEMSKFI